MLKVENQSKEEIAEIGRKIGEAFAAEKVGIVTMVTEDKVCPCNSTLVLAALPFQLHQFINAAAWETMPLFRPCGYSTITSGF